MNPNLVIQAPERIRRDSGLGAPRIKIQRADSDESASPNSTGCLYSSASTTKPVHASIVVQSGDIIKHGDTVLIGKVNDESFTNVCNELRRFINSLGYRSKYMS